MFLRIFDEGLAQASFLVSGARTREAAIIDPRRDIDVYVEAARQRGLTIAYARLISFIRGKYDGVSGRSARTALTNALPARAAEVPRGVPVAVICESSFRSSLGASLLERAGADVVMNVAGGMAAYRPLEPTR